jgi:hypothetical protein
LIGPDIRFRREPPDFGLRITRCTAPTSPHFFGRSGAKIGHDLLWFGFGGDGDGTGPALLREMGSSAMRPATNSASLQRRDPL